MSEGTEQSVRRDRAKCPKGQSKVSEGTEQSVRRDRAKCPKGQSEVSEGTEQSVRRDRAKCPKGQSKVSVLERCPYRRGHHDDVTFMTPLTVLSVQ